MGMVNNSQIERYKKLLTYIEENYNEDLNIQKVEEVCHYSYRNINRIFEALHHETIGKHIKRIRLEKAAQYLKFSPMGVSEIAFEVGFEDRAAFSKAFKNKYGHSPAAFREKGEWKRVKLEESLLARAGTQREKLSFERTFLPEFEYLFLEYRGAPENMEALEASWMKLVDYCQDNNLLNDQSTIMGEIEDDDEISDDLHFRYRCAVVLNEPLSFEPKGLYRTKVHNRQNYVRFIYQGPPQNTLEFYQTIYALWMVDVGLELSDRPVLEFYPNAHENPSPEDSITEIYIPVV